MATPVFFLFLFSSFVEVKTPSVTRSGRRKTNEAGMSTCDTKVTTTIIRYRSSKLPSDGTENDEPKQMILRTTSSVSYIQNVILACRGSNNFKFNQKIYKRLLIFYILNRSSINIYYLIHIIIFINFFEKTRVAFFFETKVVLAHPTM